MKDYKMISGKDTVQGRQTHGRGVIVKKISLSDTELDILQILWDEGSALSRPEILAKMPDKQWNPNSIHQVLNSMMKKEVLKVEGMVQCGRIYGRTYTPCITQEEFITIDTKKFLPSLTPGERLIGIVAAITNQEDIGVDTINELEQMLERRKQELKEE